MSIQHRSGSTQGSNRFISTITSFLFIASASVIMIAVIKSDVVWTWIHGDEEEDTVRFRQRLAFVVFFSVTAGLVHLRNSHFN